MTGKIFAVVLCCILAASATGLWAGEPARTAERPRYVIVTDMTHDDGNSLIRLLHYANEIDIEAIVVAPQEPDFPWNSDGPWKKCQAILDAYAKVYDRLKMHDAAYPSPDHLKRITRRGHGALPIIWLNKGQRVDDWIGEGNLPNGQSKDSEGSEFLIEVLKRPDPRPVYVGLWGAPIVFSQALYRLQTREPADEVARIMAKLHVYSIHLQDITMDYFFDIPRWQASEPGRIKEFPWTPYSGARFKPGPAKMLVDINHFWSYIGESQTITNQVRGHGPLADLYDRGGEGDTPAFLNLISANLGLNDPWDPTQGSWGNRFVPGKGDGKPWENVYSTSRVPDGELKRWAPDARACFLARLQYATKPPGQVNRAPRVILNDDRTTKVLRLNVTPGTEVVLNAAGTSDPDGDALSYTWWVYREAGTYPGDVKLHSDRPETAKASVPADLDDRTIHVIIEVRDNGAPALVAYRRVILAGADSDRAADGPPGAVQAADSTARPPVPAKFDWQGKGGFDTHCWRGFLLANNRWGGGEGRIWFKAGEEKWSFWTEHADDLGGGHVKSFPHAGIGWFWGSWAPNAALPIQLGELAVAKSSWTVGLPAKASVQSFVVYYQAYTASVPDPKKDTSTITGDLAVIVHREDFPFEEWGKPLGEFEVGGRKMLVVQKAPAIGKSTYIIMIPLEPLAKRDGDRIIVEDFDFKACVDFCVKQGYFKATDHLITIQAGWESRALHGVLRSDNLIWTVGKAGQPSVALPLPATERGR